MASIPSEEEFQDMIDKARARLADQLGTSVSQSVNALCFRQCLSQPASQLSKADEKCILECSKSYLKARSIVAMNLRMPNQPQ